MAIVIFGICYFFISVSLLHLFKTTRASPGSSLVFYEDEENKRLMFTSELSRYSGRKNSVACLICESDSKGISPHTIS